MHTIIITPTRAPIGICLTTSPSTRISNSRKIPETKVERRVLPPDFMLTIDWPIIAQPAMPPKKPVTIFASPCPFASRFLSLPVPVMSSIRVAVISDSSRPTTASDKEYGRIVSSISRVTGSCGIWNSGSAEVNSPISPTVFTSRPSTMLSTETMMIATSADGTALVKRGTV